MLPRDRRQQPRPSGRAGHWWYPGVCASDHAPPPPRHPKFDSGWRAHNTNVHLERPERAYVGYLDGGAFVLDIADIARPKMVMHWNPHPPFPASPTPCCPLFDRDLLVVSDECVYDDGLDWPKLVWLLDARLDVNPVCIGTLPLPPVEDYVVRGGRYGAHNLHENRPGPSFRSSTLLFGTYFNSGVRVHDIADPLQPKEVAFFVPPAPAGSKAGSVQINDLCVDENRIIYAADRFTGGLYVLELTI